MSEVAPKVISKLSPSWLLGETNPVDTLTLDLYVKNWEIMSCGCLGYCGILLWQP